MVDWVHYWVGLVGLPVGADGLSLLMDYPNMSDGRRGLEYRNDLIIYSDVLNYEAPFRAPEWLRGCRLGPFKSTDSRVPAGRFSRLVYAERYLGTASLRSDNRTFSPNFCRAYQHDAPNQGGG